MVDPIWVPMAAHRITALWCRLPELMHVQAMKHDVVIRGQSRYVHFDLDIVGAYLKFRWKIQSQYRM